MNIKYIVFLFLGLISMPLFALKTDSFENVNDDLIKQVYPSGRVFLKTPALNFSWTLDQQSNISAFEINFYQVNGQQIVLLKTLNISGYTRFLPRFMDILESGKYFWTIEGFTNNSTEPIVSKKIDFTIDNISSDSNMGSKIGLYLGYSQGSYKGLSHNSGLEYNSSRANYGFYYDQSLFNNQYHLKLNTYVQDFTLKGRFQKNYNMSLEAYYIKKLHSKWLFSIGPQIRYRTLPEVQNYIDINDSVSVLYGKMKSLNYGLGGSFDYFINNDWSTKFSWLIEKNYSTKSSLWNNDESDKSISYYSSIALHATWFYPFDLAFVASFSRINQGVYVSDDLYSKVQMEDLGVGVQLSYLFGTN